MTELLTRRGILAGIGLLIAAPAVVRVSSLMPIRGVPLSTGKWVADWRTGFQSARWWECFDPKIKPHMFGYAELTDAGQFRLIDAPRAGEMVVLKGSELVRSELLNGHPLLGPLLDMA